MLIKEALLLFRDVRGRFTAAYPADALLKRLGSVGRQHAFAFPAFDHRLLVEEISTKVGARFWMADDAAIDTARRRLRLKWSITENAPSSLVGVTADLDVLGDALQNFSHALTRLINAGRMSPRLNYFSDEPAKSRSSIAHAHGLGIESLSSSVESLIEATILIAYLSEKTGLFEGNRGILEYKNSIDEARSVVQQILRDELDVGPHGPNHLSPLHSIWEWERDGQRANEPATVTDLLTLCGCSPEEIGAFEADAETRVRTGFRPIRQVGLERQTRIQAIARLSTWMFEMADWFHRVVTEGKLPAGPTAAPCLYGAPE